MTKPTRKSWEYNTVKKTNWMPCWMTKILFESPRTIASFNQLKLLESQRASVYRRSAEKPIIHFLEIQTDIFQGILEFKIFFPTGSLETGYLNRSSCLCDLCKKVPLFERMQRLELGFNAFCRSMGLVKCYPKPDHLHSWLLGEYIWYKKADNSLCASFASSLTQLTHIRSLPLALTEEQTCLTFSQAVVHLAPQSSTPQDKLR